MRREKWRQIELCVFCWRAVATLGAQRLRVEFKGLAFLSTVACAACALDLDTRKLKGTYVRDVMLRVEKRDQVGRNRIRGDGTWSCKGVWQ